jgi:hypothetical protein
LQCGDRGFAVPLNLARLARKYDQKAHAPLMSVGVQRLLLAPPVVSARYRRGGLATALVGTIAAGAVV